MGAPLLEIESLRTYFYSRSKRAFIRAVDGVTLALARGATLGVVGESGSGKSVTALSITGLIGAGPGVIGGTIAFRVDGGEQNLLADLERYVDRKEVDGRIVEVSKDEAGWRRKVERIMAPLRGKAISLIFQNPKSALNPFVRVGEQITEVIRLHTPTKGAREAREQALDWLQRVKIDSPRLRFDTYPYGLSGGMCQRAVIAMALASEPSLLIADEPTTGLDATIQSEIVGLLAELKAEIGIATLLICHDIRVISRLADNVAVMYGGSVMEHRAAADVLAARFAPKHPYTTALLASIPSEQNVRDKGYLTVIEGEVPDAVDLPRGCRFYARCNRVTDGVRDRCAQREPALQEVAPGHRVRCWLYAE